MKKEEIINYLKNNKLNIQNANAAFVAADMVFSAYANSDSVIRVDFSPVFSYFSYKRNAKRGLAPFMQIISEEAISNAGRKTYKDFIADNESLNKKRKERIKIETELDEVWNRYQEEKEEITNSRALEIFKEIIRISTVWWYYGALEEGKGRSIELGPVASYAKRHNVSETHAGEIISTLSHPDEPSVFTIERQSFLEICHYVMKNEGLFDLLKENKFSQIMSDSKLNELIDLYIERYFWFKSDFYAAKIITRESLLEDVLIEIKEKTLSDLEAEAQKTVNDLKIIKEKKEKLFAELFLTDEDKKDIEFSRDIVLWIDERKIGMMKQLYYLYYFLGDLAKKLQIDYHTFSFYTISEFEELLASGKRVEQHEIDLRDECVFIVWEKNKKIQLFYDKDAEEMFYAATSIKYEEETKGQVASRGEGGKLEGIVKIILNPTKDILNEGEILVTSMTRVEFVSLMKKAKAIITNEGGIACHAAIVSRELGIPCIIGTKNGTSILKDGDRVELDLDRGVIKILK